MTLYAFGHAPDPSPETGDCQRCGRRLVRFSGTYFRHADPVCNAEMRYGERCARVRGHRDSHRTRYALDCQARVNSKAMAA